MVLSEHWSKCSWQANPAGRVREASNLQNNLQDKVGQSRAAYKQKSMIYTFFYKGHLAELMHARLCVLPPTQPSFTLTATMAFCFSHTSLLSVPPTMCVHMPASLGLYFMHLMMWSVIQESLCHIMLLSLLKMPQESKYAQGFLFISELALWPKSSRKSSKVPQSPIPPVSAYRIGWESTETPARSIGSPERGRVYTV